MTTKKHCVAILFPADVGLKAATRLDQSRHAATARALAAAGIEVAGAPYADDIVDEVREALMSIDGVLVWFNPVEGGQDRTILNSMLRDVASTGVLVSTHPDVIDRMGTKEVLYRTQSMGWGCDTRFYATADAMRKELPASLAATPRVLKQIRGQSGDGVWKVEPGETRAASSSTTSQGISLRIRHARRGSSEEIVSLESFIAKCRDYFTAGGGMIDQAFQPRLAEGMIRCYLVGGSVAGFGEQLVNMLHPAPPGASSNEAPPPGSRLYYPPTRPDFQQLKERLEQEWVDELCRLVGLQKAQLPLLWDADFLFGPKDANGADTYVLCEINVSSVYPFPDDALEPLAAMTRARLAERR